MKKYYVLLFVVCFMLSGCKNREQLESLKGTWIKDEEQYMGINVKYLEFKENSKFNYKIRIYNWNITTNKFEEGFHTYSGTYKLNKNIIYLDIEHIDNSFPMNECELCNPIPPSEKLIVDFDKMNLCDRDEGIDCKNPFRKNTSK